MRTLEHVAKVEWAETPGIKEKSKSRSRDSYYYDFNPYFSKTTATMNS